MTDDVPPLESPDWPIELVEPVERLGPPDEVFRIPRRHALLKAIMGICLIVGGGLTNYLYWVVFNGPVVAEHLLFLLLFGPIISGLGFIYAGWRDRGLWVLIYPMGLLRWQRGEVLTFPWDDIDEILFFRVVECEKPRRELNEAGEIVASWLPIAKYGSRTLGAHLTLLRNDSADAILPSAVGGFMRLCQVVQEETFRAMWPAVWERFRSGMRVKFDNISISLAGVHRDADILAWYDLEDALIQNGKLMLKSRRSPRVWLDVPLQSIPNPHVFAALLLVGPMAIPESEEDDEDTDDSPD